jgi:osmotically inducible protein OsmC
LKILYTARATSTGGRTGTAATDDGKVAVMLSTPREMGGDGGPGTNPEQLFALGYSACFLGALKAAGRKDGVKIPEDATVSAAVSFLDREDNVGFSIAAALEIEANGVERAKLEALVQQAHLICPYSHLITQKHDVVLSVAAEAVAA